MARLWQDGDYIDVSPFTDKELDTYSDNAIANKVVANELNKIENKIGEVPEDKDIEQQIDDIDSKFEDKINNIENNYLSLNGGNMKGDIGFNGSSSNYPMIKFKDINDPWGAGIIIGGGGLTAIGGGESADAMSENIGASDERLLLCNDNQVDVYTGVQNGSAAAKHFEFTTDGAITTPYGKAIVSTDKVKIVFGTVSITANANDIGTSAVQSFGVTFKYTPVVLCSIWYRDGGASSPANNANRIIQPYIISTTGASFRFFNNTSMTETYNASWIAIGILN